MRTDPGLDGTRSLDALLSAVTTGCTADEATTISRIAHDFVEHRLVESVDHNIPVSLTLRDQQRFSRNIDFFGSMTQATENKFSYQEKLRDAKVCVLGCGGLGTHILFDLAATGVHHLTIVDFDKIELSNLNRQILLDTRRSVFYSVIPGVTGCVHCWMAAARKHNPLFETISIASKRDDITYAAPAPAFVTLVAVTAGMMISEAVKIITQCQPPQLTNKLKEFTFDDLSTAVAETWTRRPDCEVCAVH